ncbi:HEPN domain-containing protein [Lonsdalea quercina]|uniref:HEPN domain-containing protein n=1 Tax=Lonsdalea quercina TaxID=71657 RepID=UPI003F46B86E
MGNTECYQRYRSLFLSLKEIVKDTEQHTIHEENVFFNRNINFFIKSYLITLCTYLESYLTEAATLYCDKINDRLKEACLPHNFLLWRVKKEFKDKELKYCNADLKIDKNEISDSLSGNPYKTIKAFSYLGINLVSSIDFNSNKDLINTIVTKRNNIIHHNDNANDISLADISGYIDLFLVYMSTIDKVICESE